MKLLFIITKGLEDSVSAIRVIQVAALSSQQGNHVEVFLLGEAVQWARGVSALGGEGLHNYLDMLKSQERPVLVCASCAERRLIAEADLMKGTVLATMPLLVEKIADPDYKVLTF